MIKKVIDIAKFRKVVESQRQKLLSKLIRLRQEDPFSAEDRSIIQEPGTDAADLFGHEKAVVLEGQLKSELKQVEVALDKFKKGTYGKCEKCGAKIDVARLEARPSAIYCLKCEAEIESGKNNK